MRMRERLMKILWFVDGVLSVGALMITGYWWVKAMAVGHAVGAGMAGLLLGCVICLNAVMPPFGKW